MLKFDMQVERNIRAIDSIAILIRTVIAFLDLHGQSPIFLPIFDPIKFLIFLADRLDIAYLTYTSLICFSSSPTFSEISLMRAKLISFLRYFFQNYSL